MTESSRSPDCQTDETDISLSKQVCIALYQASNKTARLYSRTLAPYGLTFPQFQVLLTLTELGQCTVGKICTTLDLDTSTITSVLKRLEAAGYVMRYRDRIDERRVFAVLTDKGRSFEPELRTIRRSCFQRIGIAGAELVELRQRLRRYNNAIDLSEA